MLAIDLCNPKRTDRAPPWTLKRTLLSIPYLYWPVSAGFCSLAAESVSDL